MIRACSLAVLLLTTDRFPNEFKGCFTLLCLVMKKEQKDRKQTKKPLKEQ